jgi:hypothetical protein
LTRITCIGIVKKINIGGKLTQNGLTFEFTKDKCVITSQQLGQMHIHIECMKEGSLYPIGKGIENENHVLSFTQIKNGCDQATIKWHLRFDHCNMQTLKLMKTKKNG